MASRPSAETSTPPARRAASSRRDVPPWAVALAVAVPLALAYLIVRPPARRPRGRDLPQRPVRACGVRAVGQRLVRRARPLPAGLLAALARAGGAGSASHRAARSPRSPPRCCSALIAERVFAPAGRARGRRLVRARLRRRAALGARPLRPRASRSVSALVLALLSDRLAVALVLALASLAPSLAVLRSLASPRRAGAFLGARGRWPWALGATVAAARSLASPARTGARRRRAGPDRGARARLPRRRLGAVRGLGLLAGARRACLRSRCCSRRARSRRARVWSCARARCCTRSRWSARSRCTRPSAATSARLGALLAGPLLGRRAVGPPPPGPVPAASPVLLYWQIETPIDDSGRARRRPLGARLLLRPAARGAAHAQLARHGARSSRCR